MRHCILALFSALSLLCLAACFGSDKPLLTESDATVPLPPRFSVAVIDENGTLKRESDGTAKEIAFHLEGKLFKAASGDINQLLFVPIDPANGLYLIQMGGAAAVQYYLVRIGASTMAVFNPPDPGKTGLDGELRRAGIAYRETPGFFKFDDKASLMAASRIFAAQLPQKSELLLRLAATDADIASLRRDLGQTTPADPVQLGTASPLLAPGVDAGAAAVQPCDELAAHPRDPARMAAGVVMNSIIPGRALPECERAAAQFPNTPRFRYQLGRAQEAARNGPAALASYQAAAQAGHAMALFGLANAYAYGTVAPIDLRAAADYYRRAAAAGIDVQSDLLRVSFPSDGYSNPQFFAAIFEGRFDAVNLKSAAVYLGEFIQMFRNTPECRNVVSLSAASHLVMNGTLGTLGQMFGAMANSNRNYRPGDFGAAAQSGWDAGMKATNGLIAQAGNAQSDAQTFYDRHGCDSPVSRQFFANVEALAQRQ